MYTENMREEGIEYLKKSLKNSRKLIIIDPYILSEIKENCQMKKEKKESKYIKEIKSVLPVSLEKLLIVTNYRRVDDKLYKRLTGEVGIKIDLLKVGNLHDRIWIFDLNKFYLVGTSFNGIGLSLGFIVKLQKDSTHKKLLEYLNNKINNSRIPREDKEKYLKFIETNI